LLDQSLGDCLIKPSMTYESCLTVSCGDEFVGHHVSAPVPLTDFFLLIIS
jgi:hypothetical protein